MEATPSYEKGKLYDLAVREVMNDPNQPRKYMDPQALKELSASIQKHGVLEPVLFRKGGDGEIYLVAGERRLKAAQLAGLETVPALFTEGNPAEIALVENLLRQDLTAVEEAEALDKIMKDFSYKQEDLTQVIGKAQSTISEILSLNRLPQPVRDECRGDHSIPRRVLVEIAKSKQQRTMTSLFKKYKDSLTETKKPATKKQAMSKAQSLANGMQAVIERILKLDVSAWTDEDKNTVHTAAQDLLQAVEEKLEIQVESEQPGDSSAS